MTASAAAVAAALVVVLAALRMAPVVLGPARSIAPFGPVAGRHPSRWPWPIVRRPRHAPPGDTEVAMWCRQVAAGVRGGSSLTGAVVDAGSAGSPFPDVAHAVRRGRPLAAVLRSTAGDPASAVGLAAPVLATCAEIGGPSAAAVEQLAAVLEGRAAVRAERDVAGAQARLSARVLTLVPIAVVCLLVVVEPSVRRTLVTPAGSICVAVGTGLDLVGWWWMRRMIGAAR